MNRTKYLKGACQSCGGRIEFPAEATGTTVDCPHCGKATELLLEAPKLEPTLPPKTILWTIAAVLILALGLGACLIAVKRAKRLVAKQKHTAVLPTPQTNVPFQDENPLAREGFIAGPVVLEKVQGSSLVYAVGALTNAEKRQRFGVKLELGLFDGAGKQVGRATDYQQILEPKGQWQFRALVVDPKPAVSARVLSVKEDQ